MNEVPAEERVFLDLVVRFHGAAAREDEDEIKQIDGLLRALEWAYPGVRKRVNDRYLPQD